MWEFIIVLAVFSGLAFSASFITSHFERKRAAALISCVEHHGREMTDFIRRLAVNQDPSKIDELLRDALYHRVYVLRACETMRVPRGITDADREQVDSLIKYRKTDLMDQTWDGAAFQRLVFDLILHNGRLVLSSEGPHGYLPS